MRVPIFVRILVPLVLVGIVPLLVLGLAFVRYMGALEKDSIAKIDGMRQQVIDESVGALNTLGRTLVRNQALTTAKLVDLYLKDHPRLKALDLPNDPEFQKIGIQPVGQKGYTIVVMQKEQILVAHPVKALMGVDLLATFLNQPEMQSWYQTVKPSIENDVDSEGYYKWPEQDGTLSDKYLYLAQVPTATADGIKLLVSATSYVSEFNGPVDGIRKELDGHREDLVRDLEGTRKGIENTLYTLIVVLSLMVVVLGGLLSATTSVPLKRLTVASRGLAAGELSAGLPKIRTGDEIQDLAEAMEVMRGELLASRTSLEKKVAGRTAELREARVQLVKMNVDLEKKVAERTTELLALKESLEKTVEERTRNITQKIAELEKLNKLMVGREVKIGELKAELAKKEGENDAAKKESGKKPKKA